MVRELFLASLQASRQGIPHTPTLAPWPYADGWSAQPLQIPRKRTGKLLDEVVVHDAVKRTPSGPRRSAFAAASAYRYNVEFGMFGSLRRPLCSALLRHRNRRYANVLTHRRRRGGAYMTARFFILAMQPGRAVR